MADYTCSICNQAAFEDKTYLHGKIACGECVEKIGNEFAKIFGCNLTRGGRDFCIEIEDVMWIVENMERSGNWYRISDYDRGQKT